MPAPDQRSPSRRSVVRGVAWSLPVVTSVAAAPAFAASPCPKTDLQPVTWSSAASTTQQAGTTSSGTNVNVRGAYTAGLGGGRIAGTNMSAQTVAATNDAFLLANVAPTLLADSSYQTVTFVFTRPVHGLAFLVDDIDAENGALDGVALAATPTETPAAALGADLTGAGTVANPWRTTASSGVNAPSQTVRVTYADGLVGMTSLALRFWSPTLLGLGSRQQQVRVRQMQVRTCV